MLRDVDLNNILITKRSRQNCMCNQITISPTPNFSFYAICHRPVNVIL